MLVYVQYWHHAFTHEMPATIRNIVDDTMNCEDIAINFLVAATTGQPPIKVWFTFCHTNSFAGRGD